MKTWQGIGLIALVVLTIIFYQWSKTDREPQIHINEGNEVINNTNDSLISPSTETSTKDYVADTDYACEDLIPERLILKPRNSVNPNERRAPQAIYDLSIFKNNIQLSWGNCFYYEEVGYSIGAFQCDGVYTKTNRLSPEGAILQGYQISYALAFDDNECNDSKSDDDTLDCKILDYSCEWKYCQNKDCSG